MHPYNPLTIKPNKNFIGRKSEINKLTEIANEQDPSIIVVYGRRRVGKTELLEQTFKNRNILKFEGIEGLDKKKQLANSMRQLAVYKNEPLLAKTVIDSWSEFFLIIANSLEARSKSSIKPYTIYLEELQWLASYQSSLIAELKYVWDNHFRHIKQLIIILCGSSPSFMLEHVVHSKSLYNRSQYELHLKEFSVEETKLFLKKRSNRETLDAYLTVGGIAEYLKWANKGSSVFLNICKHAFSSGGFFSREYEKIFTSSLAKNKYYRSIIEILSKKRFASRKELLTALDLKSGGNLSRLLVDLEKSGFICKYAPFNLADSTLLTRYAISDHYLQFYFKFIKPIQKNIDNGDYDDQPKSAIKTETLSKWLGFAFERWCRQNHKLIAKYLGFSAVNYKSGVFFNRATDQQKPGFQIDLVFDRADHVYTICEIKYLQTKVSTKVIAEFEKKLELFPNKNNKTIHKVLICNEGAEQTLINRCYFDNIVCVAELIISPF